MPQSVGVRVQAAVIGSIRAGGLQWSGEAYVNAAYGPSPVTLDISVESGMGQINLE